MSTEYQMPVKVHRKYAVYSKFLDTILESETIMQDGETRQDALTRLRRELDATADEWRREATVNGQVQDVQEHPFVRGQVPTISKDEGQPSDTLAAIQSAKTLEELQSYKLLTNGNKTLYDAYCNRLKELA